MTDAGWFIETDTGTSPRFGSPWQVEAGPFRSQAEAHAWLTPSKRRGLMYPDAPYRVRWLNEEDY